LFLGVSRKARQTMAEMMRRVYAPEELLDRPVEKLSGGEIQRVLLALAMHPDPELLLLDEPAAGVDFQHQKPFYELLADLNRRTGVTVLLVSHDLSVVSEHAHHVLCLKDGRIQCQGPPQEHSIREMVAQTFGADKVVYTHDHVNTPEKSRVTP
jgi:zinc transport system ATP-binding protein